MTSPNSGSEVIKFGARGHMRVSPERRAELLDWFDRSSMSTPDFAKLAGIKYQTFAYWLQRRRKARESSGPPNPYKAGPVQWFEAGPLLVVRLGSGAQINAGDL